MNKMIQKNIHKMFGRVTAFVLAFVMTLTLMPALSGTVEVKAAPTTWVYEINGMTFPTEWGVTYTKSDELTLGEYTATFKESILYNGEGYTNVVKGRKGVNIYTQTTPKKCIIFSPTKSGTFEFFICRTTNNDGATIRFYSLKNDNTATDEVLKTAVSGGKNSIDIEAISHYTEGKAFALYSNNGDAALMAIRFTPDAVEYDITIADGIEHGTVTADVSSAAENAEVTLTATPDRGYEFSSYAITKTEDDSGTDIVPDESGKFTMPEYGVTVSATFTPLPTYTATVNLSGATLDENSKVTLVNTANAVETYEFKGNETISVPAGTYSVTVTGNDFVQKNKTDVITVTEDNSASVAVEVYVTTTITGELKDISEADLNHLVLEASTEVAGAYIPETVTVDKEAATYSFTATASADYTVVATGIKDSTLTSATVNSTSTSNDLTFTAVATKDVTITTKGATVDLSAAIVVFTDSEATDYTYSFTGINNIKLREGTYTVAIFNIAAEAVELATTDTITVNAEGGSKELEFKEVNSWDFNEIFNTKKLNVEDGYLLGLAVGNGQRQLNEAGTAYKPHLLVSSGDVVVPNLKEGDEVTFEYYYQADFQVGDNAAVVKTSGSAADTSVYTVGKGETSLTAKVNSTTYFSKISVTPASAITVTTPSNGTVTTDVDAAVKGTTVTITATPDKGYEIVDDADVKAVYGASSTELTVTPVAGKEGEYTFVMPEEAVTVSVTFTEIPKNIITINPADHGSVKAYIMVEEVEKEVTGPVERGTEVTLKATPEDSTYGLSSLEVKDEESNNVTVSNDYKFTMPATAVTVTPTFAAGKYTVTVTEPTNGTVAAVEGEQTIGSKITLTITPADGYVVDTVKVVKDGTDKEVTVDASDYSFLMPASNVTVTVTFVQPTYAVAISEAVNGTVKLTTSNGDVTTGDKFVKGTEVTIAATPASEDYAVKSIVVAKTGEPETTVTVTDNKFAMPEYDVTVTVTFKSTVPTVKTWKSTDATVADGFENVGANSPHTSYPAEGYSSGIKMDSGGTFKFTVAEGKYATVTVGILGNGSSWTPASLGIASDVTLGSNKKYTAAIYIKDPADPEKDLVVTATKAYSSSTAPQELTFTGYFEGGTYYLLRETGNQPVLYYVTVKEYDDPADIPKEAEAAKVTVAGTITSEFDLDGATITLTGEAISSGTIAKNGDGTYSYSIADVAGNDEYAISVSSDSLLAAQKYIDFYSVSKLPVAETAIENANFTINYKDITNEWDFTLGKYEIKTVQNNTLTYKGLKVDATDKTTYSDPKFAVSANRVQVNPGAKVTVPVTGYEEGTLTLTFTNKENEVKVKFGDAEETTTLTTAIPADATEVTFTVTAPASGAYLTKITLKEKEPEVTPIESVTLDKKNATLKVGETVELKATVTPDNTTLDKSVSWESSDAQVATVANGVVTAVSAGEAKIKATSVADSTKYAECTVTVEAASSGDEGDKPSGGDEGDKPSGGDEGDKPSGGDEGDKPSGGDEGDKPSGGDEGDTPSGGDEGDKPADTVEWKEEDGVKYWYEDGVKQGTEGRGKEIYDPSTDAWYFLDAADGGRMAVSKDVAQPTDWDAYNADPDGYGLDNSKWKWVRYDENGHMVKGWDNNENGAYYFDLITGQMAKGAVEIGNKACYFDEVTGVGADVKWLTIDGVEYWYEGGVRQGYEIGNEAYRGKEIFDPETNAWYWLDNIDGGKKAVSKDVYQESLAGDWGDMTNEAGEKIGKWVRYDAEGHMIKGWSADHLYYFDPVFGTMAKGVAVIDGKTYNFDPVTGILIQ